MIPPIRPSMTAVVGIVAIAAGTAAVTYLTVLPPPEVRLSAFATRVEDRTRAQRHNAELAAHSLDGVVIAPKATLSFNKVVQGWSVDRGYVRAPVSFDGELVPAFGGGVCQTSTTLYNAALLAGLSVPERHHHVFAPHYIAPGRDAAVAYPSLDLRVTNPYPFPIRLRTFTSGEQLRIEIWGKEHPKAQYSFASRVLNVETPEAVTRHLPARPGVSAVIRSTGAAGFRIVTYRVVKEDGSNTLRRERLSDDAYPAMPSVVRYNIEAAR